MCEMADAIANACIHIKKRSLLSIGETKVSGEKRTKGERNASIDAGMPLYPKKMLFGCECLFEQGVEYGGVDTHIKFDTHTLWTGPHHFANDLNGLPVSMKGNGHTDRLAYRDSFAGLNKHTPTVDIRNKVDETEIHGCIADLQRACMAGMVSTFLGI
jgi:hypothetical protein